MNTDNRIAALEAKLEDLRKQVFVGYAVDNGRAKSNADALAALDRRVAELENKLGYWHVPPPEKAEERCAKCGRPADNYPHTKDGPEDPHPFTPPEATPASGWKAREWGLPGGVFGQPYDGIPDIPVVERHPQAREWWRCRACHVTFDRRPEAHSADGQYVCPEDAGWSRVLETEREPGGGR